MDVQKKLDEIVETVGNARSMPMSASCVVNRAELLAMLEEVREALPGSLAHAQEAHRRPGAAGRAGPPGGRADHRCRPRRTHLADLRHRDRQAVPQRGRPHPRRGPPGGRRGPRRRRRVRRQQAGQLRGRPHQDHRLRRPRPREAPRPRPALRRAGLRGPGLRRGPRAQHRPGHAPAPGGPVRGHQARRLRGGARQDPGGGRPRPAEAARPGRHRRASARTWPPRTPRATRRT